MKLQIKVDAQGKIVESKFKTFGCGSAIASSSVATEWLKGKTMDECLQIKNTDIAAHLKLPPVKLHCRCVWSFIHKKYRTLRRLFCFDLSTMPPIHSTTARR